MIAYKNDMNEELFQLVLIVPSPYKKGDFAALVEERRTIKVKGKPVTVLAKLYECQATGKRFMSDQLKRYNKHLFIKEYKAKYLNASA